MATNYRKHQEPSDEKNHGRNLSLELDVTARMVEEEEGEGEDNEDDLQNILFTDEILEWAHNELYSLSDHDEGQYNENCPPDVGIVTPGLSPNFSDITSQIARHISQIGRADWGTDAHRGAAVVEEDVGG